MGSSAEETIFVAVGKNVKGSKATLFWALDNFARKKICLLHVHRPARSAALSESFGKFMACWNFDLLVDHWAFLSPL